MKRLWLFGSTLALSMALSPVTIAHVGHGDEFQAEGGVDRVEVNTETDALLGIEVAPIEADHEGSATISIPIAALVEDGDRQLVFVLYDSFYEPVPVTTGETSGETIEILEGLSVGEQLVTQGSLSLYAESRKTQAPEDAETTESAEAAESAESESTETAETAAPPADTASNPEETTTSEAEAESAESGTFPVGLIAAVGVGLAVIGGAAFAIKGGNKNEN